MTTLPTDLPVLVDRGGPVPLAVQISAQLQAAVADGVLRAGDRLPSSRDLAGTLGVSRTVISTAYATLFAEGWLEGRHGSGTYVANVAPTPAPAPPEPDECHIHPPLAGSLSHSSGAAGSAGQEPRRQLIELQPGVPWTAGIDQGVWRRAWRYAGTRPSSQWPDPHGLPALRAELAGYLRRSRGLGISPANILVTRGVAGGLALLAATLIRPGDKVGIEEPGYQAAHEVLGRAGARIVPCRVDAHGVVPDELPGDLRLLYTTPAHQYPLGGRLPVGRRQALTAWARTAGAIVVEDDYDSEFRYDVGPLPALYSMDPEVIVYLGTASKVLAPAFGAGWLVATPALVERVARLRPALGERVPEPVQHALLALLTSGDLERHIRRMRLEYARRRAALTSGLTAAGPGGFQLRGDTAGMHLVLELTHGTLAAAEDLAAAAAANGVALHTLDRYFAGPPSISGLVLGYGATPLTQVRRAAAILAPLLAGLPQAPGCAVRTPLRRDRHRGGRRQRGQHVPRVHLAHGRAGEPVDVDRARAHVLAAGYLRPAEVAAARPQHAAAFGAHAQARGRLAGRPAVRHPPRVEPADDRAHAGQRAVGERLGGVSENADLDADPALAVHVPPGGGSPGRPPVRCLVQAAVQPLRRPQRAASPQDGDELHDVAGKRIPDEMARPPLADQPLRRRLDGHRTRRGPQGQPDSARGASAEGTSVAIRPDPSRSRHPCVCHQLPLPGKGLDLQVLRLLRSTYVSACD